MSTPERVALAIAMFAFDLAERELEPVLRKQALIRAREMLDDRMLELRAEAQVLLDARHAKDK